MLNYFIFFSNYYVVAGCPSMCGRQEFKTQVPHTQEVKSLNRVGLMYREQNVPWRTDEFGWLSCGAHLHPAGYPGTSPMSPAWRTGTMWNFVGWCVDEGVSTAECTIINWYLRPGIKTQVLPHRTAPSPSGHPAPRTSGRIHGRQHNVAGLLPLLGILGRENA